MLRAIPLYISNCPSVLKASNASVTLPMQMPPSNSLYCVLASLLYLGLFLLTNRCSCSPCHRKRHGWALTADGAFARSLDEWLKFWGRRSRRIERVPEKDTLHRHLVSGSYCHLTAICQRVDRIDVTRVINASTRRGPFQAKIGSGMTVDDFNARMAAGRMGHVGLPESVGMVFHTLGKKLTRYESSVEPVVANRPVKTSHFEIQPGQVKGLKQVARGYTDEGEFMTLTFIAAIDAEDDGDTIKITGKPNLEIKLKGTNGDLATVAITVNAIRRVREAMPGLVTMRDLPIVTIW